MRSLAHAMVASHDGDCDGVLRGTEVVSLLTELFTPRPPIMHSKNGARERAARWPFRAPLPRPLCRSPLEAALGRAMRARSARPQNVSAAGFSSASRSRAVWDMACVEPGTPAAASDPSVYRPRSRGGHSAAAASDDDADAGFEVSEDDDEDSLRVSTWHAALSATPTLPARGDDGMPLMLSALLQPA